MNENEMVPCPRCKARVTRCCFLCEQDWSKSGPFKIPAALAVEYALSSHVNASDGLVWPDRIFAMRKRHNYEW